MRFSSKNSSSSVAAGNLPDPSPLMSYFFVIRLPTRTRRTGVLRFLYWEIRCGGLPLEDPITSSVMYWEHMRHHSLIAVFCPAVSGAIGQRKGWKCGISVSAEWRETLLRAVFNRCRVDQSGLLLELWSALQVAQQPSATALLKPPPSSTSPSSLSSI